MKLHLEERYYPWVLFIVSFVLAFAGNSLIMITDPVESNYAETVIEMIRAGDYISPRIFNHYWYDKPIFFYWEMLLSYRIFGISEFAARFSSAFFAVIGTMLNYWFVKRIANRRRAFYSSLILVTTVEYFYLSKAVITDMTLFVFLSFTLMALYLAYTERSTAWTYAAYLGAALGTLVKGPIGLGLPGLIFLFFLLWQNDLKALGRLKIFSGMLLYLCVTGVWYGPMFYMHDGDFLLEFFGVHNLLRATVSEHPRQNVWYYYLMIFVLGCAPWSFTLPMTGTPRSWWRQGMKVLRGIWQEHRLPKTDVRTAFLFSWAFITFLFFELVQTKYMTYTFPYMIPIAFAFSSYLEKHPHLVRDITGITLTILVVLTYTVAVPQCRKASAYDTAQFIKREMHDGTTLVTFGGRYPVSLAYYSGYSAKRLKNAEDIPNLLPGTLSWNAKNMMPFMSLEALAETRGEILAVVNSGELGDFQKKAGGTWQCIHDDGRWLVMKRIR
jgi:4-amino-4-deoxy-L-arabinose transferase-like glycosyltransferase